MEKICQTHIQGGSLPYHLIPWLLKIALGLHRLCLLSPLIGQPPGRWCKHLKVWAMKSLWDFEPTGWIRFVFLFLSSPVCIMEWCQVVSQRCLKDRSNETLLLLATSGIANVDYEQAQGVDCEHPPVSQLHPLNPLCATLCFHLGNKLSFYFLSPLVTIPWEQRPCCAYPPSIQHWSQ